MTDDGITCVCLTRAPDRAAMLADALRSFAWQTHAARRLLVVNDGPARLVARDPRVDVLNLPPGLPIGARRNLALAAVRTPWLTALDDDDLLLPEHLSALLACVRDGAADAARSAVAYLAGPDLRVVAAARNAWLATALLPRRAVVAAGGYAPVDYLEDGALLARLALRPGAGPWRERRCPTPTYVHRRHGANASRGRETSGLDARVAEAAAARARWPDPALDAVNARLDALRALPAPLLVGPG